jgi:hypothetical protein
MPATAADEREREREREDHRSEIRDQRLSEGRPRSRRIALAVQSVDVRPLARDRSSPEILSG